MVDNLGMWGRGSGVGVLSKRKMRQKMLSGIPVLFPKDKMVVSLKKNISKTFFYPCNKIGEKKNKT